MSEADNGLDQVLWAVIFVLAVSFASNVSPFFGASYTLLATLQLTLLGPTPFNFLLVVLVSAVGATLAKVAIYYGAFGLKRFLVRNRNIRLLGAYSSHRSFYLILFVAALLPIFPFDDFIYIGAGATSASVSIMASVTLWAKFVKSLVEVTLEFTILKDLANLFGYRQLDITVALSAAFLVIGILVYKVDWESIMRRLARKPIGQSSTSATTSAKSL